MKKNILFLCALALSISQAFANNCFLAKEKDQILKQTGDCTTAYPPQSTFKIPLSLMGFDSEILINEYSPLWSRPENEDYFVSVCKRAHQPKTWMRDSCLWYSRILTKHMGMKKFSHYVKKFAYGNEDLSGEPEKNNGLTHAWISSSLKISPEGQVRFLQKMVEHKLEIHKTAYQKTRKIMFLQELPGGWKLYGKTGTGNLGQTGRQQGWFVGYIEKNGRKVVFASHIVDTKKKKSFASLRARNKAYLELWNIIEALEKAGKSHSKGKKRDFFNTP